MLINSIVICVVLAIEYLIVRQLGVMLARLGPIGARSSDDEGPRVGEDWSRTVRRMSVGHDEPKPVVLLFSSEACAICKEIRTAAHELARHWSHAVDIILVYDAESKATERGPIMLAEGLWSCSRYKLRTSVGIQSVPYGVTVDEDASVVGKGLVNSISHVESLLEIACPAPSEEAMAVDR
jgi:methylamine dehydrogenase accessory protein MauD